MSNKRMLASIMQECSPPSVGEGRNEEDELCLKTVATWGHTFRPSPRDVDGFMVIRRQVDHMRFALRILPKRDTVSCL